MFLCEEWRGICSLSDKILVMQLGTKTAFVVNVKQKYVTLNGTPRHMQVGRVTCIFDTVCLCIANQTLSLMWSPTQTTNFLRSIWYWVMISQIFSIGWNLLGLFKAVCTHYSDSGSLFHLQLFVWVLTFLSYFEKVTHMSVV